MNVSTKYVPMYMDCTKGDEDVHSISLEGSYSFGQAFSFHAKGFNGSQVDLIRI